MTVVKRASRRKRLSEKEETFKWLAHTQLHGANRLIDKRSWWFWIPSMIILLIFASTLVYLTISRYMDKPTFTLQTISAHIRMPFPTVLICPEIDFRTYKKKEFLASIKYPEGFNEAYFKKVLPQLAAFFSLDVQFNVSDLSNIERVLHYNNMTVESAGIKLTATCEEILIRCRWRSRYMNCSEIFRMEFTADGFCCVFNGRSLRRELAERGPGNIKKISQTLYTNWFGFAGGLTVAVSQNQRPLNVDLSYKWIALYAGNFVDISVNGTALNPGAEQWVAVTVSGIYLADSAKALSTNFRQCKLSSERLAYFPAYRKKYCVQECQIANTIKKCQCVRLPNPRPHRGVPYCDAKRLECAIHALVTPEYAESHCGCLSACDVNTQRTTTTSFMLSPNVDPLDRFYEGLYFKNVTVVRTFIEKRTKKTSERWSYYTFLDLFAQLGGMFNVFFGCSVLTILGMVQLVGRVTIIFIYNRITKIPRKKNKSVQMTKT